MTDPRRAVVAYVRERGSARELAPTTQRTARYVLLGFADACPADITRLTRHHVTRWLESQSHLAASTLASNFGQVRAFCRWLVVTGRIRKDPTLTVKGPQRPRRRPRAIPYEAVERILDHADDPRMRAAVSLMLMEGLRLAEVCSLQVGDIDWDRGVIHVIGKGDKQRVVPLTDATASAVRVYLAALSVPMVGPVIRSQQDPRRPISPNRLGRLVSDLMRDAGVKERPRDGRSAHALRHTCATDVLAAGASVIQVRDLLGHSSVETTQAYLASTDAAAILPVLEARPYSRRLRAAEAS